jgi:hypothetical protein
LFGVVKLSEKHWYTYPSGILLDIGLRRYVNHPGLAQIWVGLGSVTNIHIRTEPHGPEPKPVLFAQLNVGHDGHDGVSHAPATAPRDDLKHVHNDDSNFN